MTTDDDSVNVLVTGGCGYIGSHLVGLLRAEEGVGQVIVLDSLASGSPTALAGSIGEDLRFVRGDVREYGDVERATRTADRVVHLAAITGADTTHDRRAETFAVNHDGTENVLTAARKFDVEHVVFASSCNVYGRATSTDLDETTDPDPINPYAESKLAAEDLLVDWCREQDASGVALRMSTNYGYAPGVRFNLVVNHFVFRALTGRDLTVYGDGSNWRPFIHVEDAARAYAHAACNPDGWSRDVYNVGANDQNYRISEIADVVSEVIGPVEVSYLADEHPGPSYHVSFDRLAETGFDPDWSLRRGIEDLANRLVGSDPIDSGGVSTEEDGPHSES